jgi:hypothetical protein
MVRNLARGVRHLSVLVFDLGLHDASGIEQDGIDCRW